MRTTVRIDDRLLAAAKKAAQRRGTTFGQFVEDALRRALAEPMAAPALPVPVFGDSTGLRPGVPFAPTGT
ncbi:MAG: YlcI/YnfO family protein [Candidatus Dormibacteraceae bacterium]